MINFLLCFFIFFLKKDLPQKIFFIQIKKKNKKKKLELKMEGMKNKSFFIEAFVTFEKSIGLIQHD